jgi:cell division protein FtsZ
MTKKKKINKKRKKRPVKAKTRKKVSKPKRAKKAKKLYFKKKKKVKKTIKVVKKAAKKIIKKTVPSVKKIAPERPSLPEEAVHRTNIRIIGIGGGGASIISGIAPDVKKVDFVVANTDSKSLRELSSKIKRFQFGLSLTKGLGTGMDDKLGEMAAENEKDRIKSILRGQDLCVIVACLGGGTSSGAAPVFAKISRGLGNLTYGIFTLPFEFEGEKKMEIAKKSLERIKPYLNAYSVLPNERIFQVIDKNTPLRTALSNINAKLAENLEGLIEMIYLAGLINIDFADLRSVLQGRGRLAYLNTLEIDGPNREEAIKKVISSPLYPYTIKGAKGILYNINGGNNLQLSEVSYISKIISESVNRQAKIIFGINQNKKYQDRIRITLLATGCDAKILLPKPLQSFRMAEPKKERMQSKIVHLISRKKEKTAVKEIKNKKREKKVMKKTKEKIKTTSKKNIGKAEKKPSVPVPKKEKDQYEEKVEVKVRRNGLQLKRAVEQEEKELLDQEKVWETPAFLRKKGA